MKFAIKLNNNHYFPIDKSYIDLAIMNDDFETLNGIDEFTSIYTKEELFESFKRSNVLPEETFDMIEKNIYNEDSNIDFVIIYKELEKFRELKVFTKDNGIFEFDVLEYLVNNIDNKNMTNQLCNFFTTKNHVSEYLKNFVYLLNTQETDSVEIYFNELNYFDKRLLKTYIVNKVINKGNSYHLTLFN